MILAELAKDNSSVDTFSAEKKVETVDWFPARAWMDLHLRKPPIALAKPLGC